ncbi:MAG: hypothetical protein V1792_05795, partial [Pseudomonadota bacterium]
AEYLRVTPRYVHELVRKKRLSCIQYSPKRRFFTPELLQSYIASVTLSEPKKIDIPAPNPVRSSWKGGEPQGSESQGEEMTGAQIRKELRSWR